MARLTVSDRLNTRYRDFITRESITLSKRASIGRGDRIFAIGSCFAREIRFALRDLGLEVSPRYRAATFDPAQVRVDNLPDEEHMNFYNAFTILQEVERATGHWRQDRDDYWTLKSSAAWPGEIAYQDPYRRLIFARTVDALHDILDRIDAIAGEAILSADVFLITYGMTEVFVNRRSGRIAAQKPLYGGGAGEHETRFWRSSFDDNLRAVRRTASLILDHNPRARIFVTVSPVALERTFGGGDIYVENCEGKSTLRAVLGQITREFPAVTYFPAYEAVMSGGAAHFRDDGRHVLAPVVQSIMQGFVDAYVE